MILSQETLLFNAFWFGSMHPSPPSLPALGPCAFRPVQTAKVVTPFLHVCFTRSGWRRCKVRVVLCAVVVWAVLVEQQSQ
jgi:hypothetical protein